MGYILWYGSEYTQAMSTITFRADSEVEAALSELMAGGLDRSSAIREAILTARRLQARERLRAEAQALAADEADRAEARAVLDEMEAVRAW
jgi:Arc/MetJ-type ribon-helix-helix transcriptional regulator